MTQKSIKNGVSLAVQNEQLRQRISELENQLANPPVLPDEFNREAAFELLNTFPEGDAVDYVLRTWNECRADASRLSSNSKAVRDNEQMIANLVMMIKRLAFSLRCAKPDNKAAKQATAFLVENDLISAADCLRTSKAAGEPERIIPFFPAIRDKDGCWRHPDRLITPFDEIGGTAEQYAEWYGARGMETKFTYMSDIFCEGCAEGGNGEFPALHWYPEPPAGGGWILTMIFHTEDGVCAEWVRYTDKNQGNDIQATVEY
ncbi:hypothetical protein [Pectobacterium brasiliense]|uniref:hypothetical protein n=1 Tax=Pectobacterium brasiliense TaxID=180957 RepID=UPI0019699C20|nr:hypothetical protein [Pectobacterium brasiliense]MBN3262989.1 hypothetical protein [Pectobacterium brasiliense]